MKTLMNLHFIKPLFFAFFMVFIFSTDLLMAQEETEKEETERQQTEEEKQIFQNTPKSTQDSEEASDQKPWSDRIFYGGNFQLTFGRVTVVDISPNIGLQVSDFFQTGVGITYQYYRRQAGTYYNGGYRYTTDSYQTSIYGARLFGRYFPVPTMFAHAEVEALSYSYIDVTDFGYRRKRSWIPGAFIGGGYSQSLGRGAVNMTILYNVLFDKIRSPYNSPWVIRMGFTI